MDGALYVSNIVHDTVITESFHSTHSIAGGQKVDYVVVELCHMVAHVHLGVFISGPRVFLPHVHPQDRAHNPDNKSNRTKK